MQVPFGEWLPDQPDHLKKGANVATNVYYAQNSYKRFPSLVDYSSNTCVKDARGAGSFRDNSNTVYNFVATKDTIYKLTSGTFADVGAGGTLLSSSYATCTITVTDYSNIATDSTLVLTKNDGTTVTFTCQGAGTGTPATNKFFHNESNDTTADNIYTAINLHEDFTVANPAANIVTIEETSHGIGYLTITSSDTTRLAVTSEGAPVVESLAAVPGIGGTFDTLYMIVKRTINLATHRYVEFLEERFEPSSPVDKDDAFFVDSGLSYSGVSATTITGLTHLEGETVKILADGATHANKTVSSGQIVLDRATTKCHVGLGYTSKLVTLPLDAAMAAGTAQGKTKRISEVLLRLYKSLGGQIGPDENNLERMLTRSGLSPMDSSPPLETGDRILNFNGPHERQAKVTVIHDEPLPFTLVAIGPRAEIQKR